MTSKGEDYEVGYGKPPKQHQFKGGGASPNPGGRGKKTPSPGEILEKVLNKPTRVLVGGKAVKMSAIEVALTTHMAKAAKGDTSAMKIIVALLQLLPKVSVEAEDPQLNEHLLNLASELLADRRAGR